MPTTAKGGSGYANEAKPKPKPSNEVTRDYIPKVGMTTYTIVPQKSLEKLRYFEVELTLEAPHLATAPEDVATGLTDGPDSAEKTHNESVTTAQPAGPPPGASGADVPLRNGAELADSSATAPPVQTSISASLPAREAAAGPKEPEQAVPTTEAVVAEEVKEKKVPPATKPKPASFRLPQHKRTPGYYVTSAAVKCAGGGGSNREAVATAGGLPGGPSPQAEDRPAVERVEEVVGEVEEDEESSQFPPPPEEPAVEGEEQTGVQGITPAEPDLKLADTSSGPSPSHSPNPSPSSGPPHAGLTRQSSLPGKPPSPGLSLEKLRSFAAPKPYSPSLPSRFAQAVSSAVKKSQSHSQGPVRQTTTHKVPLYPVTDHSPIKEMTEPSKNVVGRFHTHMHLVSVSIHTRG